MASDRIRGDPKEKIAVLDSSAILMLFEFSIQLDDELLRLLGRCRIVVPKPVVRELQVLLEKGTGKKRRLAKPALKLIASYESVDVDAKNGDDSVLLLAEKLHGAIVTNDRELRLRAKKQFIPVVFLRGKQVLCLE